MSTDNVKVNNSLPPPYNTWDIRPPYVPPEEENYRYQRLVVTPDGQRVPLLALKGYEVFNCYKRFVLASGSKKTGKTLAIANRFLRNAWEIDGAVLGIIGHTAGNTKAGTWRDLLHWVIPGWCKGNFGMKILKTGSDPTSKKEYIIVSNMHGGESEIQLHSLDYELDVEKKFRSLRFSCIWLAEADLFTDRSVFDLLRQQLRIVGLPIERHQFVFDCNPPLEGDQHWLHDVFRKAADPKSKHFIQNHADKFQEIQFGIDDNPFLSDDEKNEIKSSYAHDPVKFARFCEGQWIVDTQGALFDDTFIFNIHVVGKAESADKSEWEIITPSADTPNLLTGTDIGKLNHVTSFIVPRMNEQDQWCYDCFDEICSIKQKVSVEEFSKQVWERVQFWNEWMKKTYNLTEEIIWRHWAGSDIFDYDSSSNNCDAQTFLDVSDGGLLLRSPKGQKHRRQVAARVSMMARLFHNNRFLISAHCTHNIGWARFLRPGKAKGETILSGSQHRHPFDATTYAIGAELPHELHGNDLPTTSAGIVTIT